MNGLLSKVSYSQTSGSIIKQGHNKAQHSLSVKFLFMTILHIMVKEIVIECKLAGFHGNRPR